MVQVALALRDRDMSARLDVQPLPRRAFTFSTHEWKSSSTCFFTNAGIGFDITDERIGLNLKGPAFTASVREVTNVIQGLYR